MRILGFTLLVLGFLLCITVAWAAIGFFAMGFGLICFMIAEKREKTSNAILARNVSQATRMVEAWRSPPVKYADAQRDKLVQNGDQWKSLRWKSLIENDPDVAGIARVLAQYGPKYTEQLGRVYEVFEDKTLLPIILELIITSARQKASASAVNQHELSALPEFIEDKETAEEIFPINSRPGLKANETIPVGRVSYPSMRAVQSDRNISRNIQPAPSPTSDVDDWDDLQNLFEKFSLLKG